MSGPSKKSFQLISASEFLSQSLFIF